MNWTASLLRNQLKKQKADYENRLNLLTNSSPDVQNYLELEQKLKEIESNLATSEQNLTNLKKQAESKEKDQEKALKELELKLSQNKKKKDTSKELIFNLRKEIRELNLYHQRNLRNNSQIVKEKLSQEKEQNKALIILSNHRQEQINSLSEQLQQLETKWTKEKKELREEFAILETEITNLNKNLVIVQKERAKQEQELENATGKLQALEKIFKNQITEIIRKNIIFRKSKDLKQALNQIKEIMGWTGLVLPTDTTAGTSSNTPTGEREE